MSKKHISYKFTMYLPVCKNQMDDLGGTVLYVFKVSIYGAYKTCVEWLMLLSLKFSEKKFTTIKFNRLFTNTETVTLTSDFPLNTLIDLEKYIKFTCRLGVAIFTYFYSAFNRIFSNRELQPNFFKPGTTAVQL